MARKAKNTVSISLRVPSGLKVPRGLLTSAQKSAQTIIDSELKFAALSKELAAKGISISASELAKRAGGAKGAKAGAGKAKASRTGKRRRTVLSDAQRKSIIAALKGGATVKSQADKFKCSPQTVMNIKKGAGLVKAKKARKKAAKRK